MKKNKILIFSISFILLFFVLFFTLYIKVLPLCVSNNKVISLAQNSVKKYFDCELKIKNPKLKTEFSPNISFKVDEFLIVKDNKNILDVKNLNTQISIKDIIKNKLILNHFELDYIFADINKLIDLFPQDESKNKKNKQQFEIDFYDSILTLKKSLILYEIESGYDLKFELNDFYIDNTQKQGRNLHFKIDTLLNKNGKSVRFAINDMNKVLLKNKHIYVNDCVLNINNSNVHINAMASKKEGINIDLTSNGFKVEDIVDIVNSNIIINNGSEMLAFFYDIKGNFDFKINITKNDLKGDIDIKKSSLKIIPVNNLPLNIEKGKITVSSNDIILKDFEGYYGNQKLNKATLEGKIKDYTRTQLANISSAIASLLLLFIASIFLSTSMVW